jgi:glycosyltransferase involved in cell wall biosynthesis
VRSSKDGEKMSGAAESAKPKVLFVINSLTGGGAERVMATLLTNSEAWSDRYEIALALLDDNARMFDLPEWLRVFQLDCKGGTLASIKGMEQIIAAFEPAITLSFLTRANVASGFAMMKRGRPWIISERTSTPAHLATRLRQLVTKGIMRLVYPRASRLIAVSAGVAGSLTRRFGIASDKIEIIANPVDIGALQLAAQDSSGLQIDEPYIIAVGRLVHVKNYKLLIEAFAKSELPCRLVIAGDGPERAALVRLAEELGVPDRVTFAGWLANPCPLLSRASIFALSSNVEGFPNALVEALALGVPGVATNCRDGPAEILNGTSVESVAGLKVATSGVLSPVGDVQSFARALQLAFEPPLRDRLAAAGRERARDYSAKAVAGTYWRVIEGELRLAGIDPDMRQLVPDRAARESC